MSLTAFNRARRLAAEKSGKPMEEISYEEAVKILQQPETPEPSEASDPETPEQPAQTEQQQVTPTPAPTPTPRASRRRAE